MAKKGGKHKKSDDGRKMIARNRRARHDYEFVETFEAGIVLTGSEVKSLRNGKGSIAEAYARITRNDVYLVGMNIAEYPDATYNNHLPERIRRLLLHRREITKLERQLKLKGLTLVPVEIYFDPHGRVKVVIALGRGKREYDKRHAIKKRELEREARSFRR